MTSTPASSAFTLAQLRTLALALLALATLGLTGCQTSKTTTLPPAAAQSASAPVYLAPGDVVRMTFAGEPKYTQSQKVRGDGKITLPDVGEVDVAGKRISEFQAELTRLYKDVLQNSTVTVTLESTVTPVYVSGAVARTGKLVLDRPATLLEVIMESGGFTSVANQKKVHLIRKVSGQHQTQFIDLSPALKGLPVPVIPVKANDVIFVPDRMVNL
jgi:polysaccharide export outer membrane protein